MSNWLDSSNNANCFKQTYIQGFVDVSGGSIIARGTGGGLVIGGDSSLNGTVYLGNSIFVRSDGMVVPGTADNGATSYDVSGTAQNGATSYDISGNVANGALVKPDISGNAANGATLSTFFSTNAIWSQLGVDIDGEASGDYSGKSVSLVDASGGLVVALGATKNDGNDLDNGHVRVYQYKTITDTTWNNYNKTNTTYSGKPIVIGASGDTNPVPNKKYWVQLGADIDGEKRSDESGQSVSLVDASGGLVVAIGASNNDGTNVGNTNDNRGHVRVYQYKTINETDWSKYNTTSLTYDGTTNNKPILISGGDTSWSNGKKYWVQLGADIDGENTGDNSGRSVSLVDSANGLVIAIGANGNDGTTTNSNRGHVRVYQYDATKTTAETNQSSSNFGPKGWRRLGADIDGENESDYSGTSVSLVDSINGLVVAIGANNNDGTTVNNYPGHVRVYQYKTITDTNWNNYNIVNTNYTGTSPYDKPIVIGVSGETIPVSNKKYWVQLGADIDGENIYDGLGISVSLVDTSNVLVVAIGAYGNDGTAYSANAYDDRGHVRVYQYDATKTTAETNQSSSNYGPIGWRRLGADIDGENAGDWSGYSVSLVDASGGLAVAIGSYSNVGRGHVRVYQYKTVNASDWSKYNTTSLTYDGTTYNKPILISGGDTSWSNGKKYWVQLGVDINAENPADEAGRMSLVDSANGLVVAIGAYFNDGTAYSTNTNDNRGHVRVYEIPYTKTYSDVSGGYYDISGGYYDISGGYYNVETTAALYVNGDTDLSGGLSVSGDVSFNAGNLFVAGDLSLNGNLYINSYAANSIGADAIDSTVNIEFANKLSVATADISLNATTLKVATDFSLNNTLTTLSTNLKVPANIAIVDGSNGTVYGSYLTLTNKDATAYYNVGKSVSGIFNIVDQANAGVYLTAGGTSFTGTSDARLKTHIAPLESATDKIMALNPCTYHWKSEVESNADGADSTVKPHVGFIAQEVEQVMPELVHPIDHPAGPDYKGVNTTDMIPYLVRVIQEQNAELDELTERLEKLSA